MHDAADALSAILDSTQPERLATGFVFTEGPLWHPDGFYYFVDIRQSRLHRLPPGKAPGARPRSSTGEGNGTTFDLQGRLVICEGGNRRVTRWSSDAQSEVLMDRCEGKRLNRPNDVVCHSDGSIYFTDPGLRVPLAERELPHAGVYRIKPDGSTSMVADCEYPNGLAFSPDERIALRGEHALDAVHPRPRAERERRRGAAADLRRHVIRRDRRRARRHEGGRGGPGLLHGARRHLGVRAGRQPSSASSARRRSRPTSRSAGRI